LNVPARTATFSTEPLSDKRASRVCYCAVTLELAGEAAVAFELDGEWVGKLPVTFAIEREKLRVVVP
jgi:diacylglycerol kinase family enzyme